MHAGSLTGVAAEGSLLRYRRTGVPGGESTDFEVLLNLGTDPVTTPCGRGTVVLTTVLDGAGAEIRGEVTVEGGEGLMIALDDATGVPQE